MGRGAAILILLGLLIAPPSARGEDSARAVPTEQACPVPADQSWTGQERWVWTRVCLGEEVDFNTDPAYGGDLDPRKPEGLPESRVLRPSFLEAILLDEPYRHALTRIGVRITGARFKQRLDLHDAEIRHELWLDRSLFEDGADLGGVMASQRITFDGTKMAGGLNLAGIRSERDVSLVNGSEVASIDLSGARIGGRLILSGVTVSGKLNMWRAHVANASLGSHSSFGEADISDAVIDGALDCSGNKSANPPVPGPKVAGDFNLSDTRVGYWVSLSNAEITGKLDLSDLQVGHWLSLSDAVVKGKVDMAALQVGHTLDMEGGIFGEVVLTGAQIAEAVDLEKATLSDKLTASRLSVGQSLYMRNGASFADVMLVNARIGGQLDLTGAKVSGLIDMSGIVVAREVLMYATANAPSEFADADFTGAHIGGELSMSDAKFTKSLDMDSVQVGQALYLRKATLADVTLRGARIGSDLSAAGAQVKGSFDAFDLEAAGTVELGSGSEFQDLVTLEFSKLGGLQLAEGTFHRDVNLTGTELRTELNLGSLRSEAPRWLDGSMLVLRNAKADAIQDRENSWPDRIDLTGFSYMHLGGSGAAERPVEEKAKSDSSSKPAAKDAGVARIAAHPEMIDRGASWFKDWLGRQKQYSPQPYEQLAAVLRTQGWPDSADAILYASKDRERTEASTWSHAAWLFALKIVIGYGYQVWLSLIWIAGLLTLGAVVQSTRPAAKNHNWHQLLHYSFEMLLPVIRLRGQTREFIAGWQDYYFHFHGIMGFVLAAFLAAGLSGLTTR
ncbi:MAG TPA: hypothetical protein VKU84_10015 [Stellaceae bacterium]|nr:hypothetical protein [Stellaceae bacterium]